MKVNVCMIAKDRPRLTSQALRSLERNTPPHLYSFTIIDDGSYSWDSDSQEISYPHDNWLFVRLSCSKGIVGFARNLSIQISEQYWGRGDFLYLSDNDVYFQPGWLEKMIAAFERFEPDGLRVLGGVRHPFHGANRRLGAFLNLYVLPDQNCVALTDAVAGYSHLMRWETWDKYGPFDAHAQGVCKSEDFAFCQKIVKDGGLVGYIEPPVLINCGLTNTEGNPAVGSEAFPRVEGVFQQ